MALEQWALPQISHLIPLEEETLRQMIAYVETLSKDEAAEHLKNLLGDSPQALEFISAFNSRRGPSLSGSSTDHQSQSSGGVPKAKPRKKAPPIHKLPEVRRPENEGNTAGGYVKREEQDYMPSSSKAKKELTKLASSPQSTASSRNPSPKPPPSASGHLISDVKHNSSHDSQANKPKAKVTIQGGTSMHGQSSTLKDLDSAIRALEIQTNPNLGPSSEDDSKRRCNCMATRHPLLTAAPNCLNCGKIVCVKEGLGPCTFCHKPLVSSSDIQSMIRVLREERGREKMSANNATHKRAEVSSSARPFSAARASAQSATPTSGSDTEESEKLAAARQHRDKLLGFQAENARRTRIHDEVADFETPVSGQNMWASPRERALQLKRQQKVLREQEWSARPEYERRRVVVSVDLVGGKIVKRMADVERPASPDSDGEGANESSNAPDVPERQHAAFSRNPLLGQLIRPVARKEESGDAPRREKKTTWRRVQDDEDNEQWILDGGSHGFGDGERTVGEDDQPCG